MEADGVISPVTEPTDWCSALVVVPKLAGSVRLCVDLANFNKAVRRRSTPRCPWRRACRNTPVPVYFLNSIAKSGHWQTPREENSRHLTTFITPFGRSCMNRLPFCICSASEIFQHMMSEIHDGLDVVVCHMDDVLVHAETEERHDMVPGEVLPRLSAASITLNDKCEFEKPEVKFLDHIVNAEGVRLDSAKVKATTEFPAPQNVTELERFFCKMNYLAKFMPGIAHKTEPLRQPLRKGTVWTWNETQSKAFQDLNGRLSSETQPRGRRRWRQMHPASASGLYSFKYSMMVLRIR